MAVYVLCDVCRRGWPDVRIERPANQTGPAVCEACDREPRGQRKPRPQDAPKRGVESSGGS
jgi:hypothetical protein